MAAQLASVGIQAQTMAFSRGRPAGDFAPELDDLRLVRDRLLDEGASSVALVGRSFGGRMCARLAAIEPPAALVLLGPSDLPAEAAAAGRRGGAGRRHAARR